MFIINPFSKKKYFITDPKGKELLKCYIQHYQSGGLVNQYIEYVPFNCSERLWMGPTARFRSPNECITEADKTKLNWITYEKKRLSEQVCNKAGGRISNTNICECIETQNENSCDEVINRSNKPGHKIIAEYELNKNGLKDRLTNQYKRTLSNRELVSLTPYPQYKMV